MAQYRNVRLVVCLSLLTNPKAMTTSTDLGTRQTDPMANEPTRAAIIQLFADSPYHELRQVRVLVTSEEISLTGTVPSFFIKQVAQETARQESAARKIHNEIRVL
jgi:osmotically-inducible protein OsmY